MVLVVRSMNLRVPVGALEINLNDGTSTAWFEASLDLWRYWLDMRSVS